MNALDNANIEDSTCSGLASFAFPMAKSSKSGVSVEYVHDETKQWYVLRILHGQVINISDLFISDGNYAYAAMLWKVFRKDGKKHKQLVPFLNLLFAYLSEEQAESYVKCDSNSRYITYYYNHFVDEGGKNPPLVIKENEMKNLILASSQLNEHVMNVDLKDCKFESDELVEVTDGPFKGIVGRVARIARQKRVVITMQGISSAITTAYIPPYFLRKISTKAL